MTLSGDDDPGYDPQAAFHRAAADDADDTIEMTDAIKPRRHSKRGAGEQQQKTSTAVADAPAAASAADIRLSSVLIICTNSIENIHYTDFISIIYTKGYYADICINSCTPF